MDIDMTTDVTHKKLICLDFDGVINSYVSGWQGATQTPDPPTPGAIAFIREVLEHPAFDLSICTSRFLHPSGKDTVRRYLATHGLEPEEIEQVYLDERNPPAFVTLDDRAMTFNGAFPSLERLGSFLPWYKKAQRIDAQVKNMQLEYLQQQDTVEIAGIRDCARCGGVHTDVTAVKLLGDTSSAHATHFVTCPTTQQPILVTIELTPTLEQADT